MITADAMALCRSCRHIRRTRCDLGLAVGSSVTDATVCGNYDGPEFSQDSRPGLQGDGEIGNGKN